jgi:hypothetical protein
MRQWGVLISVTYVLVVLFLLVPLWGALAMHHPFASSESYQFTVNVYRLWGAWVLIGMVLLSQVVLVFVSVDTSWQRPKPRSHILATCIVTAFLLTLLALGAGLAIDAQMKSSSSSSATLALVTLALVWLIWGVAFYEYSRNSDATVSHAIAGLLVGSVLELLIAVPCHIAVRRRNECSAPIETSFGICTGIAVMLLAFGPSVLLLYKKRLESYAARRSGAQNK